MMLFKISQCSYIFDKRSKARCNCNKVKGTHRVYFISLRQHIELEIQTSTNTPPSVFSSELVGFSPLPG